MTEQITSNSAEMDPDAGLRDRLADEFMAEAAFDGWTRAALAASGRGVDLPAGEAERLFRAGPLQALAYVSERADRRTVEDMEKEALRPSRSGPHHARGPHPAGAPYRSARGGPPGALDAVAEPLNAGLGLKLLYKTVDAMWYAAGDTSTDFNFYTKRATLAGVYSSTLLYWLNDRSPGAEATWAFLDRRIDDVMKFEKLKGRSGPGRVRSGRAARPQHVGDVAHLAAGAGFRLAIEMQPRRRLRQITLPTRPPRRRQVLHPRGRQHLDRAQRQAADGPHQLLELLVAQASIVQ